MRLAVNAVGAVMGGAARHLPPFVAALASRRPDWSLSVYVSDPVLAETVGATADVELVRRHGARRVLWDALEVGQRARRRRADALLNLTNYGPLRAGVPSVLYQRNPVYFDPTWTATLEVRGRAEARARRRLAFAEMARASAVITPSHAMASYLRSWRGCPASTPIVVVPHAVDTGRFASPGPRDAVDPTAVSILSVSHGAPHKGQDLLVALLAELDRRGVTASVRLTADRRDAPSYVEGLLERARARGLEARFQLTGRVDDVERLYRESDIFVFPSITESFGFPLLEALSCGVPVVASGIPSSIELLGDLGEYFVPRSARQAADAVERVLARDAAARAAYDVAATRRAAASGWDRNAEAVAGVLEEVTFRERPPA